MSAAYLYLNILPSCSQSHKKIRGWEMSIVKDLKRIRELVKLDPRVEDTEEGVSWLAGIVKDSLAYTQIVEVLVMDEATKHMPFEAVYKIARIVGVEPDEVS